MIDMFAKLWSPGAGVNGGVQSFTLKKTSIQSTKQTFLLENHSPGKTETCESTCADLRLFKS